MPAQMALRSHLDHSLLRIKNMFTRGFSLLETVLYMGLLAIILPPMMLFTLGFLQKSSDIDMRIRMEQKAALLLWELQKELTSSRSINVTDSVLGTENSSLVYLDTNALSVTIDRPSVSVPFKGGEKLVKRLRRRQNTETQWMSDADMSVENWFVTAVRDSGGALTGLRFTLTLQTLNEDGNVVGDEAFTSTTTIHLQPQTTEL